MPTYTRPTDYLDWGGTKVEPTLSEKATGFVPNFRPPAEWHNWMFSNTSDWVHWLDQQVQANLATGLYDAVVGTGGTHASINAVMADANIANIYRVLVTTPQTVSTTQVINKSDIMFDFKESAVYSQGASLAKCISIAVPRVRIRGGRFTGFSTSGNVAIQIETGIKNCMITEVLSNNNDTFVNDLGSNNVIANNIEEV